MEIQQLDHLTLHNRFFQLDVLTQAGPRISALIPAGTHQNLLAKLDDSSWDSPYGRYLPLGGHRLWSSPEIPEITYFPELSGAHAEVTANGARLWRQDHGAAEYERTIEIALDAEVPRMQLVHSLRNLAAAPLKTAPWTISMLPMGSRVRLPLSNTNFSDNVFLPNRAIAFWPYDDLHDPRYRIENDFVELQSDPTLDPFKIGVYSMRGWAAAQIEGWLLVKHFEVCKPNSEVDFGANIEAYTNQDFVEFELLGEMRNLKQGEFVHQKETWEVIRGNLDDLDSNGHLLK